MIRDTRILFNLEKRHHEPAAVKSAFDTNYDKYKFGDDRNKELLLNEYWKIIRPYLKSLIDNHIISDQWKTQLLIKILHRSLKDINENLHIYLLGYNKETMIREETNKIIK